jgi:Tfp pilus assembly protein PilW
MKGNESGFSLLELTMAAVLTVGVMGAVLSIANRNQSVFITETSVVEMNQNIRTSMDLITRDIQSAGMGLPIGVGNFAAIFYTNGTGSAPDSMLLVNGDPFAPVADVTDRSSGSSEFFLMPPPDVARTGSGSSVQFTYLGQNKQPVSIYQAYSVAARKYIVYDDTQAMIFTLSNNGQITGSGSSERLRLQHNSSGYQNPPSVFGATIGTGEPDYDNSKVALLGATVSYRLDTTTNELLRTEDLQNWYAVARGIIGFQVRYRILRRNTADAIEEKLSDTPGDGVDKTASNELTSRKDIHSVIITMVAETPDIPRSSPSYRRIVHKFEVAPRNLNLVNNNNIRSE